MEKKKGMGGHQSAKMLKDEWLTPRHIITALGPFDLDPCSPIDRPWPTAATHYTVEDDGLTRPWDGFVWCNPPYGPYTSYWMERMAQHDNGIALIFARTETSMFFDHIWPNASAVMLIEGRLFFHHVDGTRASANSGAPSILLGYGDLARERLKAADIGGVFIDDWRIKTGWTMKSR